MNPVQELSETAKEVGQFNEKLAGQIVEVAQEFKKEAITGLLQPGMRVVCVNPVQGIFKGRIYLVQQFVEPGVVVVTELDGTNVGAFRAGRFCKDNQEF